MPSRAFAAVRYALRGVGFMLAERNCQVLAAATIAAVAAGGYFRLSAAEWCALVLATTAIWVAEGLNTAIERLTDLVSPGYHPLAEERRTSPRARCSSPRSAPFRPASSSSARASSNILFFKRRTR